MTRCRGQRVILRPVLRLVVRIPFNFLEVSKGFLLKMGPRAFALPVADEAKAQCVPRSVCNAGVHAKAHSGHRKRNSHGPAALAMTVI